MPVAQHAVGRHTAAHDHGPGAAAGRRPEGLRREHVDHRILERPGELGDDVRWAAREPSGSAVSASGPRAAVTARRAAVLRPLKLKSPLSPIQARGKRRSRRVAVAAAVMIAGPPG